MDLFDVWYEMLLVGSGVPLGYWLRWTLEREPDPRRPRPRGFPWDR